MSLRELLREQRTVDGLSVTAGAVATVLFWAYLNRDANAAPAPEPCTSAPYAIGERPACIEVAP